METSGSESEPDISTSFFMCSSDEEDHLISSESPASEELLYPEAPAGLTVCMANVMLFQFSVKHSLTSKALQELLHMIGVFLPKASSLPKTVRQLKQYFLDNYKDQCPQMEKYCSLCQSLFNEEDPCNCNVRCNEFVNVPIGPQLKARLESNLKFKYSIII